MTSESPAQPPSRDELKSQASELGIDFPANIPTPKLEALIAERAPRVEAVAEVAAITEAPIAEAEPVAAVDIDGRPAHWVDHFEVGDNHAILYGDPSKEEITQALNALTIHIDGVEFGSFSGIVHSPARKHVPARIAFNARFPFNSGE